VPREEALIALEAKISGANTRLYITRINVGHADAAVDEPMASGTTHPRQIGTSLPIRTGPEHRDASV